MKGNSFISVFGQTTFIFCQFTEISVQTRKNVISGLSEKFFTDMTINIDFTEGSIFMPYESSQSQFLKKTEKTGVKFGLISKFSRNLNFCS